MRIVTKCITNRLKLIIVGLINESQTAFIPKRHISDNILIAHEMLHHNHKHRIGRIGKMAIKIDIHKAYDKIDWLFLKNVLIRMGFSDAWIRLIMASLCHYGFLRSSCQWDSITPISAHLWITTRRPFIVFPICHLHECSFSSLGA